MVLKIGTYKIRMSGRGAIITIPETGLNALGANPGDDVDVYLDAGGKSVIVVKAKKIHPAMTQAMQMVQPKGGK